MEPKKAKVVQMYDDDDDDWDALIEEEEEIDDIIDDDEDEEEDDLEDEEPAPRKFGRSGEPGKAASGPAVGKAPRKKSNLKKKIIGWTVKIFIIALVLLILFAPGYPFHDIREMTGINSLKNLMRPHFNYPEWANVSVTLVYDLSISNGRADEVEIHVASPFDIPRDPCPGEEKDYLIEACETFPCKEKSAVIEIIQWLANFERRVGELYRDAANLFAADKEFSTFLNHLAADEDWHFQVMGSAAQWVQKGLKHQSLVNQLIPF